MRYNMDFLVAALIFLIVLWHHFMKQRQFAGNKTEKTFQIFMMLGIGDIVLDMVSTIVIGNSRPEFSRILYVILLLFYLCQLLIPPVLYLYTLALAGWSVEEKLLGIRCYDVYAGYLVWTGDRWGKHPELSETGETEIWCNLGNSFYYGQLRAVAGILSGNSDDRICHSTLSDGSAACFS